MHQFWLLQTKFIRAFVRNNDLFSTLVIISNSNQNGHKSFICGTLFPLWKKNVQKVKKTNMKREKSFILHWTAKFHGAKVGWCSWISVFISQPVILNQWHLQLSPCTWAIRTSFELWCMHISFHAVVLLKLIYIGHLDSCKSITELCFSRKV